MAFYIPKIVSFKRFFWRYSWLPFFNPLHFGFGPKKTPLWIPFPLRKAQLEYLAAQIVKTSLVIKRLAALCQNLRQYFPWTHPENRAEVAFGYLGMGHYGRGVRSSHWLLPRIGWAVGESSTIRGNWSLSTTAWRHDLQHTGRFSQDRGVFLESQEVAKQSTIPFGWPTSTTTFLSCTPTTTWHMRRQKRLTKGPWLFSSKRIPFIAPYQLGEMHCSLEKKYEAAINAYQSAMHYTSPQKFAVICRFQNWYWNWSDRNRKIPRSTSLPSRGLDLAKEIHYTEQIMESLQCVSLSIIQDTELQRGLFLKTGITEIEGFAIDGHPRSKHGKCLDQNENGKKRRSIEGVTLLENEKAEQQRNMYLYLAITGLIIAGLIGFFLYKIKKRINFWPNKKPYWKLP